MNTIWTFGDSFTFGAGCRCDGPVYLPDGESTYYYDNYKTKFDDIFPNLLSKILNFEVKNFGYSGASNDTIIDSIIDNWDFIKEGDFVITQITFFNRIDVPYQNRFESPNFDKNYLDNYPLYKTEEKETIINFQYYFTNSKLYKLRYLKRFKFLENLLKEKKVKTYFWNLLDLTQFKKFERIIDATDGKIPDGHFSFKGHEEFANMVYKKITNQSLI